MLFSLKKKKNGKDSSISSNELIHEDPQINSNDEMVDTPLSFHPEWEVPAEKKYVYQFLNNECEKLKPNQISLSGIEINKDEATDDYIITAFIRSSLPKPIHLPDSTLLFIAESGEVLGRKRFSFQQFGELPPNSSRPWNFLFSSKDLYVDQLPREGWKLAFELKQSKPHQLDLEKSWEQSLSEENKNKLEEIMKNINPPKPGEVNFLGLQASKKDNGDLHIMILIRNGSEKNIQLEKLPLIVEDAYGEMIAKGGFELDNFEVKANTSKPWSFIFPKSLVQKEEYDLTKWKVYPPQND
ncbi:accessory Sec system S-layer assembly protein [Pseudalkalibacillus salsuginis]|uniref:accessory Sec system S-layer assembly protein n=1 Tax=Pseudalkalibacillus salsuginis TaxID=2910972 RepID=UPI001F1748D1|nr:accessory Sec system S-layer assembly protein [Pseudalkalibacillus salsuginis]MCF6410107.1 accessory Sec system S-layer assembly protein [Pseudalkalibacillus salsuginis]